jgi:Flp pilus assembly protein TadG
MGGLAWRRATERADDGAAAVEFALVVPLLVMLVFGIVGFGVLFAQQLSLSNSARQGARFGVVASHSCAQILHEVQQSATTLGMKETDVAVEVTSMSGTATATPCPAATSYSGSTATTVPCQGSDPDDEIIVTTGYRSRLVVPLVVVSPTFDLAATGVFRCEFS